MGCKGLTIVNIYKVGGHVCHGGAIESFFCSLLDFNDFQCILVHK